MALHQEGAALQAWILALADHSEHALVRQFQIVQKAALQLSAAVGIGRGSADLLEGQAQVALEHLRPK